MKDRLVTNWYHCPKCDKPVDPIPMIIEKSGREVDRYDSCPYCCTKVEVRSE